MARVTGSVKSVMKQIIAIKKSDVNDLEKEIMLNVLKTKHSGPYNDTFERAINKLNDETLTPVKDEEGNVLHHKLASMWARRFQA